MIKINMVLTIMLKKLFVMFMIIAILSSISEAREVGICKAKAGKSMILAYQDDGKTLIIDGKYTAKIYDGDIIYNDEDNEVLIYDAYENKKYDYHIETYLSQTNNKIKKQLVRVNQINSEIVYTCEWYKE